MQEKPSPQQELPQTARSGQHPSRVQVSESAQHVSSQARCSGQHAPLMHVCRSLQQIPLQIWSMAQQRPSMQTSSPVQHLSPQVWFLSQHVSPRQIWPVSQQRFPQTIPSSQQVSLRHVAPSGQHSSGQARREGQQTCPLTQRSSSVQQCPPHARAEGQQAPSRHRSLLAQQAPPQAGVGQVQTPKMQTLFPVHWPQLLPQPSGPHLRPLQFGTHGGGGLGGGFWPLSLSFPDFFFFFFFFFFLRLEATSSPVRTSWTRLHRNPMDAATRATPRRGCGSPSARVSLSNCPSSTARHSGRHPRSHASLPAAQARNHARDWVSSLDRSRSSQSVRTVILTRLLTIWQYSCHESRSSRTPLRS